MAGQMMENDRADDGKWQARNMMEIVDWEEGKRRCMKI
jgi:hypothetical protein